MRAWLIATAASLAALLAAVTATSYLPWPAIAGPGGKAVPDPLLESVDWRELGPELEARGLAARPGLFVAATRWHEAGKIDYALGGGLPVLCLCRDARGYGVLMRAQAHLGGTGLIIGRNLSPEQIKAVYAAYFDSIEPMPPITTTRAGRPALVLSAYLGHGLRGASERPSLLDPLSLGEIDKLLLTNGLMGQCAPAKLASYATWGAEGADL